MVFFARNSKHLPRLPPVFHSKHPTICRVPETSDMRRKRIECSPVKAFYRTVQLEDMSDLEVTKAINHDVEEEPNLSDSMYVNHDSTFLATQNLPEYGELKLL